MSVSGVGSTGVCLRRAWHILILIVCTLFSIQAEAKPRFSAIAVDARTGKVLFAKDADGLRHPASLTKVMTLYLVFRDLDAGTIKLDTSVRISRRAAGMAPSKLGLKPGASISVSDAIKALVTRSANDIAAALGEHLAGSELAFAERMTQTAKEIGMSRTIFRNASGLPDPAQVTTARDMATLSLRVQRDFPQYYPYFRISTFVYQGTTIRTHNRLIGRYAGTDGIKTGYIRASGFNLATSVKRGQKRIVGVVLGASSTKTRNAYMTAMLDRALPKCEDGKMIAALVGTSKGAIEPAPSVGEKPSAMDLLVASSSMKNEVETGDTPTGSMGKAADQIAPKVLEAKISPPSKSQLPFKVKAADNRSWHIQIGAYPTKKQAQAELKRILAGSSASLFKNKPAFTVTVQKGDAMIYRARLSGFSEKSAKGACRQLSKRKIDCFALAPHS